MAIQKMTTKMRMETVPVTMHMKMNSASVCPATLEACSGHSGKSESIIAPLRRERPSPAQREKVARSGG